MLSDLSVCLSPSSGFVLSASVRLLPALRGPALLAHQWELPGSGSPRQPGQRAGLPQIVSVHPLQLKPELKPVWRLEVGLVAHKHDCELENECRERTETSKPLNLQFGWRKKRSQLNCTETNTCTNRCTFNYKEILGLLTIFIGASLHEIKTFSCLFKSTWASEQHSF